MPGNDQEQVEQLRNAIATLEAQRDVLGEAVVEASLAALRKQLAELEAESGITGRHKKLVSVVFVDVVDSTKIGQHLEPDEILEIMDGCLQRLSIPIAQYGGRVTRFKGDGFKAVFGEPVAQENDAEMAVRAGLAIQEDARAFAVELQEKRQISNFAVRVGVNTGMVAIGGFTESDDTVMGLTVNLGARLESAAPPGGLLISQATYQHVRGMFEIEPLPPVVAKGFPEPVKVYLVKGSRPREFRNRTRGVEGVVTRMIGREAELKRLQDVYYACTEDKEFQIVTVIGEAGVGKSRLLEEFEIWLDQQAGETDLLKGRSSPELQESPYSLLRDVFGQRFQIQASDKVRDVYQKFESGIGEAFTGEAYAVMQAHFIGQLLGFEFGDSPHLQGVSDDAMQLRDRAWIYLSEFVKQTATFSPLLIFLDDVHWADDSSLDLINYLGQSLSDQRVMVVCLARSVLYERRPLWGEGQKSHTKIDLNSLSTRDCRRLVEEILQRMGQVPLALRELVVSNADGNPFYIEELIKILIDSGVIIIDSDPWRVDPSQLTGILAEMNIPTTLSSLLQARIDQLVPDEKKALQQASVVGRVFWDEVVYYLESFSSGEGAEKADISGILDKLRQKEMIYHRETSSVSGAQEYFFKHTILRDVAYDTILKKNRVSYHAMVAKWLMTENAERAGELTGMIAEHLESAGEISAAISYYRQAGEQAARQYANQSALRYLDHALEMTGESELHERFAILLAREQVYSLLGSRKEQGEDLEQLVRLADQLQDEEAKGEVALLQASAASERSEYSQIIAHAQESIRIAQSVNLPYIESKANLLWGRALLSTGDYPGAESRFSNALRLAKENELSNLEADSLRYLGSVDERLGKQASAIAFLEEALQLFRQIGDRRGEGKTLNQLGNILLLQGDHARGKRYYDQFLTISREIGDRWGEGQVIRNIADTYLSQYDYAGASKYFEQALEITREIGNRTIESSALVGLGNIYIEQGEYTKAKKVFEQSLNIAREIGNRPWEAKTLGQIGKYFHRQGDYLRAQSYYDQAIAIYQQLGNRLSESRVLIDLSLLYHDLGDDERALEKSEIALSVIEELHQNKYKAQALHQMGRAQVAQRKFAGAEDSFRQSFEIFNGLKQENQSMEPLAGMAKVALLRGDRNSAMEYVEQILDHLQTFPDPKVTKSASSGEIKADDMTGAVPGLEGTRDPTWIYWTCYQILKDAEDPRAVNLIGKAHELIEDQAQKIEDSELRYSFLSNVRTHQKIRTELALGENT